MTCDLCFVAAALWTWSPLFDLNLLSLHRETIQAMIQNSYRLSYFRGPSNIKTLPCCLCYVDHTTTTVHKSKIHEFHKHWNKRNTSILLAEEIEENGEVSQLSRSRLLDNTQKQYSTNHCLQETNKLTEYLTKRLAILLQSHKAATVLTQSKLLFIVLPAPSNHYSTENSNTLCLIITL